MTQQQKALTGNRPGQICDPRHVGGSSGGGGGGGVRL